MQMQILNTTYSLFFRLGSRQSSSRRKRRGWFTCLKKSRSGAASTMIVFYCCYPYIVDIASIMIVIVIVIISFYMTGHWLNIFCENSLKTEAISHAFDFDLLHPTPSFLSFVAEKIMKNGQVGPRQEDFFHFHFLKSCKNDGKWSGWSSPGGFFSLSLSKKLKKLWQMVTVRLVLARRIFFTFTF